MGGVRRAGSRAASRICRAMISRSGWSTTTDQAPLGGRASGGPSRAASSQARWSRPSAARLSLARPSPAGIGLSTRTSPVMAAGQRMPAIRTAASPASARQHHRPVPRSPVNSAAVPSTGTVSRIGASPAASNSSGSGTSASRLAAARVTARMASWSCPVPWSWAAMAMTSRTDGPGRSEVTTRTQRPGVPRRTCRMKSADQPRTDPSGSCHMVA